jgi:hypothetical protein
MSIVEQIKQVPQNIGNQISNLRENVTESLNNFSLKNEMPTASNEYLQSNSIIAKFVFFVLVLICFMVLLNLGVTLVAYFLKPSANPYIVKGLIDGNRAIVVSQDPKNSNSATILRSNDQTTGLEFTWSVWLYIMDNNSSSYTYQNIFNKGNGVYDKTNGLATVNNGPGLYLNSDISNTLHVVMDNVNTNTLNQSMNITNVPFNNWFHVALRMQNNILDVYINGTISGRLFLNDVARQNYNDVNICQNGGFNGHLSNLRYYSTALSAFEINNIVMYGPNKTPSSLSTISANKNYNYLSNSWYTSKF